MAQQLKQRHDDGIHDG